MSLWTFCEMAFGYLQCATTKHSEVSPKYSPCLTRVITVPSCYIQLTWLRYNSLAECSMAFLFLISTFQLVPLPLSWFQYYYESISREWVERKGVGWGSCRQVSVPVAVKQPWNTISKLIITISNFWPYNVNKTKLSGYLMGYTQYLWCITEPPNCVRMFAVALTRVYVDMFIVRERGKHLNGSKYLIRIVSNHTAGPVSVKQTHRIRANKGHMSRENWR